MSSNKLINAIESGPLAPMLERARGAQAAIHRHPRRFSALGLAIMAGSAVTAFGVAPLTSLPDSAKPAITQLTEALPLPELPTQLAQLDDQALSLFRSDVTRQADTIDNLLSRLGVNDAAAAEFLRNDPVALTILQGRVGKQVQATVTDGHLERLIVRGPAAQSDQWDTHFTRVTIERQATNGSSTWHSKQEQALMDVTPQLASGTILSSLYQAADDAKVPDSVTNQIAEIFGSDIDFRRELRKGDAFSVVYEAHTADGEPVTWGATAGRVLAARFINKDTTHDAVWYQEPGRKGAYFDSTGRSKTRAFLASPLAFSRVTSGFSMRFHSILQSWRAHLGVDYGAPTGTAVRSVGDAVVSFAGQQNGYGNVIQLQHAGDRMTVYAHLSRIDVRRGQRVEQGQLIGAVGATGWATGPHLHFEFRVKGQHVDPMIIARASESFQLSPVALAKFRQMVASLTPRLNAAGQLQTAGAQSGPRFE